MQSFKMIHLLADSKIHLLIISTFICMNICRWLVSDNVYYFALLYAVMAMWMVVDYTVAIMMKKGKIILQAYAIPAITVSFLNLFITGETVFFLVLRLFIIAVMVFFIYNLFNMLEVRALGLMIAVVIEIIVPVNAAKDAFLLIIGGNIMGLVVILVVAFLYYSLTDYSAYLKYQKKEDNEKMICELLRKELSKFFSGNEVDWQLLRFKIRAFKDNRFFYNKQKNNSNVEDKAELFYNMVLEIYCLLTMLKGFRSFDNDTALEVKKVFGKNIETSEKEGAACYYENVAARSILLNFNILCDILENRVKNYIFKLK